LFLSFLLIQSKIYIFIHFCHNNVKAYLINSHLFLYSFPEEVKREVYSGNDVPITGINLTDFLAEAMAMAGYIKPISHGQGILKQ